MFAVPSLLLAAAWQPVRMAAPIGSYPSCI